eukprot:gene9463-11617_t
MGKTLLVKNADLLVTMNGERPELKQGGLFIEDNIIRQVGPSAELPQTADEVLDLKGHIVIPGLVNTHHHMYQSLTRVIPTAQNGELFNWLTNLYPIWANLTSEMVHVSTLTAMSELMLSGCTTTTTSGKAEPSAARTEIDNGVDSTLNRLYAEVKGSRELVSKSNAVLVFPRVLAAGLVVGG